VIDGALNLYISRSAAQHLRGTYIYI